MGVNTADEFSDNEGSETRSLLMRRSDNRKAAALSIGGVGGSQGGSDSDGAAAAGSGASGEGAAATVSSPPIKSGDVAAFNFDKFGDDDGQPPEWMMRLCNTLSCGAFSQACLSCW